jgi:hypothetical protein
MTFDSDEEKYFYWYLEDLKKIGFVEEIIPQHPVISLSDKKEIKMFEQLKTKQKPLSHTLLHKHIYTPDFTIVWNEIAADIFTSYIGGFNEKNTPFILANSAFKSVDKPRSIIEIKPSFDQHNMTRAFTLNQKWIYNNHDIYVQLIKPVELFKKTFIPTRYIWTNNGTRRRKINFKIKLLKEYLCQRKKVLNLSKK